MNKQEFREFFGLSEAREKELTDYFESIAAAINQIRPERHARVVYNEGIGLELNALDLPENVYWCVSAGSEFWNGATSDNVYGFQTTVEAAESEWLAPYEMAKVILVSLEKYVERL